MAAGCRACAARYAAVFVRCFFIWRAKPAGKISLVYAVNEGLLDQQRHSRRRRMLRRRAGRPLGCGRQAISPALRAAGRECRQGEGPCGAGGSRSSAGAVPQPPKLHGAGFPDSDSPARQQRAAQYDSVRKNSAGRTRLCVRLLCCIAGRPQSPPLLHRNLWCKACYPKERGRSRSPAERWRKSGQVGLYSGKCRRSPRRGTVRYVNPSSLSAAQTRSRFSPMAFGIVCVGGRRIPLSLPVRNIGLKCRYRE